MIHFLLKGFSIVFSHPINILVVIFGVGIGIIIGAMPGLTATMGIAIALPLTFGMPPEVGLTLLCSIFIGGIHGGGIPGILIKTPGTPASAATISDGFALTEKGEASKALGIHAFSSSAGSFLATLILIFASTLLANFALKFGAAEYFLLAIFGLSIISAVTGKSILKGLIAATLGLLISTIGLDPIIGFPRFTFGNYNLMNGFSLVPALIGLFAISQIFSEIENIDVSIVKAKKVKVNLPSFKNIKKCFPTIIRSAIMGTFIGAIPGPGAILGSFIPYGDAKRRSKNPEKFGQGALEGIAAAESGNNSAAIGALIPTLTLGIPGEAATAVLLGGLMILGLRPGPMLFKDNPEIVYTVFASIMLAALVLLIEGLFLAQYMGKLITIPKKVLLPSILLLCIIGSFAIRNSVFDIGVALGFGILGYFLTQLNYPVVPILLGLILGPIAESNFRRALIISKGSFMIFFNNWLDIGLILLTIVSLILGFKMNQSLNRITRESSHLNEKVQKG
ncbi:C4-dicarboxylate ABC transporter permease [Anoxybacter fermentans]|uniref:C4-dicarboxylate ABC transporter permease n=1 Tax=Anoxybacter fermentans TaxID=1323375 RepID=A0A3Q9HU86_9FIRM|nr:tripartite tricarboxylate transporter permease [Anoxybacter fermentans]AZR74476.1 C4-dicarboxylate ABC transporter permease [Anoxybacter fermentans]